MEDFCDLYFEFWKALGKSRKKLESFAEFFSAALGLPKTVRQSAVAKAGFEPSSLGLGLPSTNGENEKNYGKPALRPFFPVAV